MLDGNRCGRSDFEDPRVVLEGLPYLPVLPGGSLINERSIVFGLATKEPRGVPKWSLRPVPNRDGGTCVEKVEVLLIARVPTPDLQLCGLLPLVPRPPQTQSPRELVGVEDPESTIGERPADNIPIDLAICPRCRIRPRP